MYLIQNLNLCYYLMLSLLSDTEKGSLWDLWALDWVQQKAECLKFCIGRAVTPAGQLPVSTDIEYEFGSRNPYNFLQVTYYKVNYSSSSCYILHCYKYYSGAALKMIQVFDKLHLHFLLFVHQLEKLHKAASAAHTYFVANPSHLEMRNNIEKYRRMKGVTEEAFQDRETENEKHWVSREQ